MSPVPQDLVHGDLKPSNVLLQSRAGAPHSGGVWASDERGYAAKVGSAEALRVHTVGISLRMQDQSLAWQAVATSPIGVAFSLTLAARRALLLYAWHAL